ncbi:MAG TPA: YdcF family protein [Candidatus Limnocylindrales bacterium]
MPRALSARNLAKLALVVGGGAIVLGAYGTYRIWDQGAKDERRPAGAIVVLGAAQYDGRPSPVFAARLDHAVALYLSGLAPYLVVTGGKQEGDRTTEAATARSFALARGVPAAAILVEDKGRTTVESLSAVSRILDGRDIRAAVFVSDPTHMLRVLMIARDDGLTAYGSPTPTSPVEADTWSRIDATAHELGGIAQYLVQRWTGVTLGVSLP